jgi:nitroimidazol reductase NimA-like FMN-containing flavoprotein (pyridoxamine 5'-phosphate oxidase superfamily)
MNNPRARKFEQDGPMSNTAGAPSARTIVKRGPTRAAYEKPVIHAILDEAFICHVGFVYQGSPRVIPCVFARKGDLLYLHGSTANRMLRSIAEGEVCVTVTLLDGLVLARSAFHHSVNYRSVVVYGRGEVVTDAAEKQEALRLTVEHAIPGRWDEVRSPNREEDLRTLVVRVPLDEASAKIRVGDPVDDDEDHALDCWAGVIPLHIGTQPPVDDGLLRAGIAPPDYAVDYRRPTPGD